MPPVTTTPVGVELVGLEVAAGLEDFGKPNTTVGQVPVELVPAVLAFGIALCGTDVGVVGNHERVFGPVGIAGVIGGLGVIRACWRVGAAKVDVAVAGGRAPLPGGQRDEAVRRVVLLVDAAGVGPVGDGGVIGDACEVELQRIAGILIGLFEFAITVAGELAMPVHFAEVHPPAVERIATDRVAQSLIAPFGITHKYPHRLLTGGPNPVGGQLAGAAKLGLQLGQWQAWLRGIAYRIDAENIERAHTIPARLRFEPSLQPHGLARHPL